ncbi:MAG TPA: ribosome maturation factor RimM [Candidatus Binataceae bacterium]|nr:ribosome maturation factor RimM [Candidatus Binataceae bacterium]
MAKRRARPLNDRRSAAAAQEDTARRPLIGQTADGLLRIGYVAGSHGLHGALRVRTDDPGSTTLGSLGRLLVETAGGGGRREFKVLGVSALSAGNQRVVLEGIGDADAAEALRGGVVMVAATDLPPLKEGEFYYFQLVGAEVMLTDGRRLGSIEDIMSTGAHDVWVVRDGEREVLVPVIDDVVKAMDLAARRVTIEAVPGLLD